MDRTEVASQMRWRALCGRLKTKNITVLAGDVIGGVRESALVPAESKQHVSDILAEKQPRPKKDVTE